MLSWPDQIAAARDAGQPTDDLEVPLSDDAQTHTLTAQTTVLGPGVVDVSGTPQIQPPPQTSPRPTGSSKLLMNQIDEIILWRSER
jgi:hypothetical protein